MSAESEAIKQTVRRLIDAACRVNDAVHAAQLRHAFDESRKLTTVKVGLLKLAHRLMPEWVTVGPTDDFMCEAHLAVSSRDGPRFHVPRKAWLSPELCWRL